MIREEDQARVEVVTLCRGSGLDATQCKRQTSWPTSTRAQPPAGPFCLLEPTQDTRPTGLWTTPQAHATTRVLALPNTTVHSFRTRGPAPLSTTVHHFTKPSHAFAICAAAEAP